MSDAAQLLAGLTSSARTTGNVAEPRLAGLAETEAARMALSILGETCLTGWAVPEEFGGAHAGGLCARDSVSVRALCALRDELAWHSGMLDVMFVMQGLGSFPIVLGGEEQLKREVLPAVARGERIAAFALTEPDAGSSLGDVSTRA
jgi:acyl-CoA dehydrogenase